MKIAILPSTQWTSVGNGIGSHVEAELAQDVTARLVPKLQAAGHTVRIFAGSTDANTDGAHNCVSWGADVAISLHLDSASGTPAALLCYQESRSLPMGLALLHYYCQAMGIHDKGGMIRVPGQNGVAVIRIPEAAGIRAALIEMGDMNRPDGPNWIDPNHREKAAQALAIAITTVFGGAQPVPARQEEDDDDMIEIQTGALKRFPAMPGAGKKTFFDLTDESKSTTGAKVRLSARRDFTAKYPKGDWTKVTEETVKTESTFRFEASQYFGVTDEGYTVKIEVLTGGPVGVTRKQTLG